MDKDILEHEILDYVTFPYKNKHTEYNLKDYNHHIFYHPDVPEGEVAQVIFKEKRIGWIFPINRLESNLATLENEVTESYLIKHMEIAVKLLVLSHPNKVKSLITENRDGPIKCSEILNERAVIFIESKKSSSQVSFNGEKNYFQFLLKCNLTKFDLGDYDTNQLKFQERLKLKDLSSELANDEFASYTFPDLYESTLNNEFLTFTVLYQVIEYFIEKNFTGNYAKRN